MRTIEVSLAARLACTRMPRSLIVGAFRQSLVNGTSFIDELYASGRIHETTIGQCIADEAGLLFEDVPEGVRVVMPSAADFVVLRGMRHTVVLTSEDTTLIYIAPSLSDLAAIKNNLPGSPEIAARLRITTPYALDQFLVSSHETALLDRAIRMVEITSAEHSAKVVATGTQGVMIGFIASSCLFTAMLNPGLLWQLLHALFSSFFSACILLRLLARHNVGSMRIQPWYPLPPSGLPGYSVLIALYHEADVVPQLVNAMRELNWPRSKLDVLFLCELDDIGTIAALQAAMLPAGFRIVRVPSGGPRTKPKALNYGLQLAKGDFVVVYDAEDRPHPQQLQEAWWHFAKGGETLGCLQAPLVIANAYAGRLTRLFAFEYAAHFRGILPWLARHGLVMPLGGSSNHFRRGCLEAVGGWDPFNVTEDAELGTRLARCGFEIGMLTTPTIEDAPAEARIWLRQRTRWIKGWMQTWLVEMRRPIRLLYQFGARRFTVYQLLSAGMIVSALLYPLMLVSVALSAFDLAQGGSAAVRRTIVVVDVINIVMGYLAFHALGRRVLKGGQSSRPVLVWIPFYWLMISAAAWRALWQLHRTPFLWEKTPHRPATAGSSDRSAFQTNSAPEPMINVSSLPIASTSRPL